MWVEDLWPPTDQLQSLQPGHPSLTFKNFEVHDKEIDHRVYTVWYSVSSNVIDVKAVQTRLSHSEMREVGGKHV